MWEKYVFSIQSTLFIDVWSSSILVLSTQYNQSVLKVQFCHGDERKSEKSDYKNQRCQKENCAAVTD